MDIVISPRSDQPIYVQIVEQLTAQILRGELASNTALPPIRSVARQLEVSVITVKKAWEELERAGLIHAIVGKGTFVAERQPTDLADQRLALAADRLAKDLPFYRTLGLRQGEFIDLLEASWGAA